MRPNLFISDSHQFLAFFFKSRSDLKVLAECKPIYETLSGWPEDITNIREMEDLPQNTKNYLNRISEMTETPIHIVSVGPARDETIVLKNPFL